MLKKYPKFFFGYFCVFIAEILAITNDFELLGYIAKPLITILLMGFIINSLNHRGKFSIRIIIGLLFSLVGDVMLMFDSGSNLFFVIGLLSFLLAHIFYIDAFYIDIKSRKLENPTNITAPITVFFGFAVMFYVVLFSYLRELEIPVALYCVVIATMAVMAYMRYKKCNRRSYQLVLAGAVFFLVSDSFLAYNKFVSNLPWMHIIVMTTYMFAQLFITLGTVERKYKRETTKMTKMETNS